MKVIDFEAKGNAFRLYYGRNDCNDYWGDDWDDRPLNNCGNVYPQYVSGYVDFAFPLGCAVLASERDWHYRGDVPFCKEDYKNRKAPCLVVLPEKVAEEDFDPQYSDYLGTKQGLRIYFDE